MKALSVLALLGITLSSGSITEIRGPMKAHETISKSVELESGKSSIEVVSSISGGELSCRFSAGGTIGFEQPKTTRCFAQSDALLPTHIEIQITNEANTAAEYKIVIQQLQ